MLHDTVAILEMQYCGNEWRSHSQRTNDHIIYSSLEEEVVLEERF